MSQPPTPQSNYGQQYPTGQQPQYNTGGQLPQYQPPRLPYVFTSNHTLSTVVIVIASVVGGIWFLIALLDADNFYAAVAMVTLGNGLLMGFFIRLVEDILFELKLARQRVQ